MSASGSGAWAAVRRALGKLAGRVVVREMPPDTGAAAVAVRESDALTPRPVAAGRREGAWAAQAASHTLSGPEAGVGAQERDLLPLATLAGSRSDGEGDRADFTLRPATVSVLPVLQAETSRVVEAGLDWPLTDVCLPEQFFRLPAAPTRVNAVALLGSQKSLGDKPLGANQALGGWAVRLPKTGRLKIPRSTGLTVRWGGDSVLERMPLVRRGRVPLPGRTASEAFAAEHRRLAEAMGLPPGDVALLGVFPGVPILAVRRILVADDGQSLRLWLKPDVVRARTKLRFITLLVGRQVSSGRMLQAAL